MEDSFENQEAQSSENEVGVVQNLDGRFYAVDENGNTIELQNGDVITKGMKIVGDATNQGTAKIEISNEIGEPIVLSGTQEQTIDTNFLDSFFNNEQTFSEEPAVQSTDATQERFEELVSSEETQAPEQTPAETENDTAAEAESAVSEPEASVGEMYEATEVGTEYDVQEDSVDTENGLDDGINVSDNLITNIGDVFGEDSNNVEGETLFFEDDVEDDTVIQTGDGDDTVILGDDLSDEASIFTGAGDDTVYVENDVEDESLIDTGSGDDSATVGDDLGDGARINTGSGNDTVVVNDLQEGANIDLGSGNDSLIINDKVDSDTGTITGGEGTDSLVLESQTQDAWDSGMSTQFQDFESVTFKDGNTLNLIDTTAVASSDITLITIKIGDLEYSVDSENTQIIMPFGTLTVSPNGDFSYVVNNENSDVQALNIGDSLDEGFSYTLSNGTDTYTSNVNINIDGRDDAPVIKSITANDKPFYTIEGLYDVDGDGNGDNVAPDDMISHDGVNDPIKFDYNNGNISVNVGNGNSSMSVDYHGGTAAYKNILGFYEKDDNSNITDVKIIYVDKGDMDNNGSNFDSFVNNVQSLGTLTDLNGEVGFFIIPNGYSYEDIQNAIDNNYDVSINEDNKIVFTNPSDASDNITHHTAYYTDNNMSTDGKDHAVFTVNPDGGLTIGMEDLSEKYSDQDYDDVVFTIKPCTTIGTPTETVLFTEGFENVNQGNGDTNINTDWYVDHGTNGDNILISNSGHEWIMNESGIEMRESGGVHGLDTADGSDSYIEMDAHTYGTNSSITTTVYLGISNESFNLSFDFIPRPGQEDTSDMKFSLDGKEVSINIDANGNVSSVTSVSSVIVNIIPMESSSWYKVEATFSDIETSTAQLNFQATGIADTLGAYIDNIKLIGIDSSTDNTIIKNISLSDVDDVNLDGASIAIINYKEGDVISADNIPSDITATVVGGFLELSGTASVSDYELAIESLTFVSTSEDRTPREFAITVFDGHKHSDVQTINVDIGGCSLNTYNPFVEGIKETFETATIIATPNEHDISHVDLYIKQDNEIIKVKIDNFTDGYKSIDINGFMEENYSGCELIAYFVKAGNTFSLDGIENDTVILNNNYTLSTLPVFDIGFDELTSKFNKHYNSSYDNVFEFNDYKDSFSVSSSSVDIIEHAQDAPTIDAINNNGEFVVNGTAQANSAISVYNGTTLMGTTIADADGNWTFTDSNGELKSDETNIATQKFNITAISLLDNIAKASGTISLLTDGTDTFTQVTRGSYTDDIIYGGDEDTTSSFGDYIEAGKGDDTVYAGAGSDQVIGGKGADRLDGGTGFDHLRYDDSSEAVNVNLSTNEVSGGDANGDTISNFEAVWGSNYNDNIVGNDENNTLLGLDGNDIIDGAGGKDYIRGGAGDDTIKGGAGDDHILGGTGADIIDGGEGFDTLSYVDSSEGVNINLSTGEASGGDAQGDKISNFEMVWGSKADDVIVGDANDNVLVGDDGDDRLVSNGGNDYISGMNGNDTVVFSGNKDDYTIGELDNSGNIRVEHNVLGKEDSVLTRDVEIFEFADGRYNVSTSTFIPFNEPQAEADDISLNLAISENTTNIETSSQNDSTNSNTSSELLNDIEDVTNTMAQESDSTYEYDNMNRALYTNNDGVDVVEINKNSNTIMTYGGDDIINVDGNQNKNIDAGDGNNRIDIDGNSSSIFVGDGNDQIRIAGNQNKGIDLEGGNNQIDVHGNANNIYSYSGDDIVNINGNANGNIGTQGGDDYVRIDGNSSAVDLGSGNDIIQIGGNVNKTVQGGDGVDSIILQNYSKASWDENLGNIQNYILNFENIKFSDGEIIGNTSAFESKTINYHTTISIVATQEDTNEALSDVIINISSSVEEVQDADGNSLVINNGVVYVPVSSGIETHITLISNEELSQDELNAIQGSVTTTESNGSINIAIDAVGFDLESESDSYDILSLEDGMSLDFSNDNLDNISNLDMIDMDNDSANSIDGLTLDDILEMTDDNNTLTIMGDDIDSLNINTDGWSENTPAVTDADSGITTYEYSNGSGDIVILNIEDQIDSTGI